MPLQPPLTQVQPATAENDACSDEEDTRLQTRELVFVNGPYYCRSTDPQRSQVGCTRLEFGFPLYNIPTL